MRRTQWTIEGITIPVIHLKAAVVGSGCAGFQAADCLHAQGIREVAIVTEGVNSGTSRNTGSDKQTYYKLSLCGEEVDSVVELAQTLASGGGVHGDIALCEAASSARCFIKLCELGVPFPTNAYGEYAGYKTDHDPRRRATSAGPLTSRYMTEALERSVRKREIPILDGLMAFRLMVHEEKVHGLVCLDLSALDSPSHGLTLVLAPYVVLATGGPAACYADVVYPTSQSGMSGMALMAGAAGANLHIWQYGLASVKFRWNVSGSYQQAIPRYVSIDDQGVEREFIRDAFDVPEEAYNRVFLKGYQWPYDPRKREASSMVDVLVHRETATLGRRVFMDYRREPRDLNLDKLSQQARGYLVQCGAMGSTPLERLAQINAPAIDLYRSQGIDLAQEMLEIRVCAQHHNGGLAVDANWQTGIQGLYAVGECAGTFGNFRPGGSALNSTQVGGLRAAQHIALQGMGEWAGAETVARDMAAALLAQMDEVLSRPGESVPVDATALDMSRSAAHVREIPAMAALAETVTQARSAFWQRAGVGGPHALPALFKCYDALVTRQAVLSAMLAAQEDAQPKGDNVLTTAQDERGFRSFYEPVRPMPQPDRWFETVWREYMARTGSPSGACV